MRLMTTMIFLVGFNVHAQNLSGNYVSFSPGKGGDVVHVITVEDGKIVGMEVDLATKTLVTSTVLFNVENENATGRVIYDPCRKEEIFHFQLIPGSQSLKIREDTRFEEFVKITEGDFNRIYDKVAELPSTSVCGEPALKSYTVEEIKPKLKAFMKSRKSL